MKQYICDVKDCNSKAFMPEFEEYLDYDLCEYHLWKLLSKYIKSDKSIIEQFLSGN